MYKNELRWGKIRFKILELLSFQICLKIIIVTSPAMIKFMSLDTLILCLSSVQVQWLYLHHCYWCCLTNTTDHSQILLLLFLLVFVCLITSVKIRSQHFLRVILWVINLCDFETGDILIEMCYNQDALLYLLIHLVNNWEN